MFSKRKFARKFLLKADRPGFKKALYQAKISPRQEQIVYMRLVDKYDYNFIADTLNISAATVRNELQTAYDQVFNYLFITV